MLILFSILLYYLQPNKIQGLIMLLTSYRQDIYGIDGLASTPYGQRNSKSLFFDELPEEEKHNAIFKVL